VEGNMGFVQGWGWAILLHGLTVLGGILLVLLVLFLFCRELVCWYFKINKMVSILETIAKNTEPGIKQNAGHDIKTVDRGS